MNLYVTVAHPVAHANSQAAQTLCSLRTMSAFQNGSDDLFHLSPFTELHESTISPVCRPFPPELVLSSDLPSQYPTSSTRDGIESEQLTGDNMQSEVPSGNTVST